MAINDLQFIQGVSYTYTWPNAIAETEVSGSTRNKGRSLTKARIQDIGKENRKL